MPGAKLAGQTWPVVDRVSRRIGSGGQAAACLGAGIARTRDLIAAGVPVGLGVDGAASNESSRLLEEAHQAVLMARAIGGPTALTTREALELATLGGARVLGYQDTLGSIEPGKLADVVITKTNPLQDIRSLENPDNILVVIKGGQIVKDRRRPQ